MIVKNTCNKIIGIDKDTSILPEKELEISDKYKSHPSINLFIRRGWLKEVAASVEAAAPTEGIDGKADADERVAPGKPLDRMNKAELVAKAAELGLELPPDMTNPKMAEAIEAKLAEGTGGEGGGGEGGGGQ